LRVPVTQFSNPAFYQLVNYDGRVGDFNDPFIGGAVIAQGVPADFRAYRFKSDSLIPWAEVANPGPKYWPDVAAADDRLALLAEVTADKGQLGLMPTTYGTQTVTSATGTAVMNILVPRTVRWLASDVPLGGFRFYYKMNALAYLDQWDDQRHAGRFVVHDLDLDADMMLSDSVREQFDIWWPWVGVVYAVADGDRQGIWMQKAN
jgi:hypothetical protein